MSDFDPLAVKYTFMLDEGEQTLTYGEYLKNDELRRRVNDRQQFSRIILGRRIILMSRKRISLDKNARVAFNEIIEMKKEGGLMYFAPNGPGATGFLNEQDVDIVCLLAGNQRGKTATGIVNDILNCIPCDPNWPIFKEYGVNWRPWTGETVLTILTYQWTHSRSVIWPRLKEWLPRHEIEDYLTGKKVIRWDKDQHLELKCGSIIPFRVYSQDQEIFEGPTWMRSHWDEQGVEAIFDGVDERTATQGYTPSHIFTLTPHEVEGRPDTGGGSWIEKLVTGENTKGKTVKQYQIHPDHVPDWIYPETEKIKKFNKWIKEPSERGDMKVLREGRSRYYGEWHIGGGLVYDEWVREIHMIDPIDIPWEWTRYRSLDHGTRNPMVCLYAAVSDRGDLFIYDEYYETGNGIEENVKNIIERCGNERRLVERFVDNSDKTVEIFEEVESAVHFERTVMDPRSFGSPDPNSNLNLGKLYQRNGLRVRAGTAQNNKTRIPAVKEWLRIDYEKKHPVTGKMGKPKTFVFSTCKWFVKEIEARQWKKVASRKNEIPDEVPEKKNDHTQNSYEFLVFIPPRYYPPTQRRSNSKSGQPKRKVRNARTKY